jgi:hypothetical protein
MATLFPQLSDDLGPIDFTSAQARALAGRWSGMSTDLDVVVHDATDELIHPDLATTDRPAGGGSPIGVRVLGLAALAVIGIFAVTRIGSIRGHMSETADTTLATAAYAIATVLAGWRAVAVRAQRWSWACLTVGLACYTAASIYAAVKTSGDEVLPFPSIADLFWLLLVPFACIGIAIAARQRLASRPARELLAGAAVALGIASVVVTLAIERWLTDFPTLRTRETIVKFGYPTTDALLIGAAVGMLVVAARSTRLRLLLLAGGLIAFAAGDIAYLMFLTRGEYTPGDPVDLLYVVGLGAVGLAAWWGARDHESGPVHVPMVVPALGAAAAVGVLVFAAASSVTPVSVVLAVATLLAFAACVAAGRDGEATAA